MFFSPFLRNFPRDFLRIAGGDRLRTLCRPEPTFQQLAAFEAEIFSLNDLPSGKLTKSYGKSQFFMGKSTISMVIFNSYVANYQRVWSIIKSINYIMIYDVCYDE